MTLKSAYYYFYTFNSNFSSIIDSIFNFNKKGLVFIQLQLKQKKDITRHYRQFYTFEGKEWSGYKYQLSIDTMHILAELSQRDIDYLKSLSDVIALSYKYQYDYTINLYNVKINLYPRFPSQFNACIQVQQTTDTIQYKHFRDILMMLNDDNHIIIRLDLAYDFKCNINNSYTLARHGLQKQKNYDNGNNWVGSTKNHHKTCTSTNYKKSLKLLDREGIHKSFEYDNRYEVRLFFTADNNMRVNDINDGLIIERLNKEIFIPDITLLDVSDDDLNLIKLAKKTENEYILRQKLTQYQRNKFRKMIKDSPYRADLSSYYAMNRDKLFNFYECDVDEILDNDILLAIAHFESTRAIDELLT